MDAVLFVQQPKGAQALTDNKPHADNEAVPRTRTNPEVQLLPDINSIACLLIWLGEVLTGCSDSVKRDL